MRTPPLYFAVQNTEEEIESNPPLIAVRYSAYGARQGRSLEVALYSFAIFLFQPPRPAGTPPIFPYRNTPQCCGTRQGERRVNSITSIAGIFNPSPRRYTPQLSPIFFAPHTAMLRGTAREDCDTKDFLSLSKKVLVTLIRFICSFFSTARRTNQEAPPQLSGFWVCRRSRRRGLRNSLRSDSPRPFFLRFPCDFTAR